MFPGNTSQATGRAIVHSTFTGGERAHPRQVDRRCTSGRLAMLDRSETEILWGFPGNRGGGGVGSTQGGLEGVSGTTAGLAARSVRVGESRLIEVS